MPEELLNSGSSQGSTNPRLRSTQRVRAVPYECCGGLCNFLNTGCFSMCCGVQKNRSYDKKRRDSRQLLPKKQELSESSKKVIKPNSDDGITDVDFEAFQSDPEDDFYHKNEKPGDDLFISETETDEKQNNDAVDEEKSSACLLHDDSRSEITDGISVTGSEVSKKSKKSLMSILGIKKKKKIQDSMSLASLPRSVEMNEPVSAESEVTDPWKTLEKSSLLFEKCSLKSKSQEFILEESSDPKSGSTNVASSATNLSEGKPNEDQSNNEKLEPVSDSETSLIKVAKVITLGATTTNHNHGLDSREETPENSEPLSDASTKKQKGKFFWKSKKPKTADSEIDSKSNSEKRRKSFLGKWGSTKRHSKSSTTSENLCEKDGDDTSDQVPDTTEDEEEIFQDIETPKTASKNTLLRSLGLSKKNKNEKVTKCTNMPSLFNACTNSNINQEVERKLSSDSVEVKTIVSFEGKSGSRETSPIRIVRNDFFPTEIRVVNDMVPASPDESIVEASEENQSSKFDNDDVVEEDLVEEVGDNIKSTEGIEEHEAFVEEVTSIIDSPSNGKKYGVINIEDFSESLHTLHDQESTDYVLLAPRSVLCDPEKEIEENDSGKNESLKKDVEENTLPDGIYRTSYRLSIEGSTEGNEKPSQHSFTESASLHSSDTLTESKIHESVIEKSDDTLVGDKETESPKQVDNSELQLNPDALKQLEGSNEPGDQGDNEGEITCGKCCKDSIGNTTELTTCICSTLTRPRQSISDIEEGNVKRKIAILDKSEHPIIVPLSTMVTAGEPRRKDDVIISEAHSSPTLGSKSGSKSATPSPIAAKSRSGTLSSTNSEWQNAEEDIDRLMVMQGRNSLSSLGLRSDSMASVYSGAGEGRYGTVTVRGQVEFGLQYNYKAGALEIHVKQCRDLAPVDTKRNRSDPYVKVYLLPDKSKGGKRKTKVKKHTLNPVFDETLKFHISLNGLETRTLWLTVWHSDMFGRNDFLGEVMMALENKVFDDPTPKLYNLQERTEPFDDTISFKGDIIVCLKFVPPDMTVQKKGKRSRGTLHVLVKEAKYLTAYKANGTSDPFCKSYLLPDKGRNSKQKTPVVRKTINPVWNHTFIYEDVTLQELAERCLELTVWDHDRLASNEFLGGVRFSLGSGKHYGKPVEWMDATGKEMTLWKSMLERPNFWVEGCLSLRPTLDARTS